MNRLERTLGGEFVFDKSYLENAVRSLASKAHHVTYNLNALTDNAYIPLYDAYQDIRTILDDILTGNTRALSTSPVLPLKEVGWELEQLVGVDLVCLAELQYHSTIQAADGFVVTAGGAWILRGQPAAPLDGYKGISAAEVRSGLAEQFRRLLGKRRCLRFSVMVNCIDEQVDQISEIGQFYLVPDRERRLVEIVTDLESGENIPSRPFVKPEQEIAGEENFWVDLYVHAFEEIVHFLYAEGAEELEAAGLIVLFVRYAPATLVRGSVETRRGGPDLIDSLNIIAQSNQVTDGRDMYRLRRTYPFDLIESVIPVRPEGYRFADGQTSTGTGLTRSGVSCERGSALVSGAVLRDLAKTAMSLERVLGMPVTIEWEMTENSGCQITRLFQMQVELDLFAAEDLIKAESAAVILCQGGEMVQSGVGAGKVVHVNEEMSPADFPAGAVAVARFSSPQLTPILQRAAAVVTEYGTATGHLATVARELRLPAVFGVVRACTLLPPDIEVTVHAGEARVYEGVIDILLRKGTGELSFSPYDEEYRILRRLLRFIMLLHLIDPEAANFRPEACRTLHDVIHFSHEKAVEELAHFQERRPGLGAIRTRRMELGMPMDIQVLDIGGGLKSEPKGNPVPGDVCSEPFSVFLSGLLDPASWKQDTPVLGFRDIVSSMPRSMGMLAGSVEAMGSNLAIIGVDYINISLRLGYHFSVIDSHLGSDDSRNYVYFRFAGGLADPERGERRAHFIRDVLQAMDFKVSVKGDLVIGRLKSDQPAILRAVLWVLGALTAYSRQRDTALSTDEDVRVLYTLFASAFLGRYRQVVSEIYGL